MEMDKLEGTYTTIAFLVDTLNNAVRATSVQASQVKECTRCSQAAQANDKKNLQQVVGLL